MFIEHIEIQNFKRFEKKQVDLNSRFSLLVGDNGAGKTTILDALAVSAGIWLVNPPDSSLAKSGRNILSGEIRRKALSDGDRVHFVECKPVSIAAKGLIADYAVSWEREIVAGGVKTTNARAKEALCIVGNIFMRGNAGEDVLCPVLAYYGAGRSWLPSMTRMVTEKNGNGPARRWQAFYGCFDERVRLGDLATWFQREVIAFANRGGKWRPGYEVVKRAVLRCVPGSRDLWFDGDRDEIVICIDEQPRAFGNLSAGQKMMVALIADIAIKAVTQNSHLLPKDQLRDDEKSLPEVLRKTPGLVLIDELDVHLHPKWQRQVVDDLKETFPAIQFVCTSHSPFIIQSIEAGELITLDKSGPTLVEYANKSIEDIAEGIQQVEIPQQSEKAREMAEATGRYFELLEGTGSEDSAELKEAEIAYRKAAARFSENPGLTALLELEAMTKQKADHE